MKSLSCFYWGDAAGDLDEDWKHISVCLEEKGIKIEKVQKDFHPPKHGELYDALFFDYGGMRFGSPGMIEWAVEDLLKLIEDNPSKYYVLASRFTLEAAKEFGFDYESKVNVFSSVNSFIESFKGNEVKP